MQLDKAIQERKSVRHFSKKSPNWKDIVTCIDAARYAPTAGNIHPMKWMLVNDKDTIKKLANAAQQNFITEAKYVVVLCTESKRVLNAYEERAEKFCRQQAGAAIENFLLKLQEKKLATCWVGYFVDYLVKEALNIPDEIDVEAFFPIGYEPKQKGKKRKTRNKLDMDKMLYVNKWKNKKLNPEKKLNV